MESTVNIKDPAVRRRTSDQCVIGGPVQVVVGVNQRRRLLSLSPVKLLMLLLFILLCLTSRVSCRSLPLVRPPPEEQTVRSS